MNDNSSIRIENLGKSYRIRHKSDPGYGTFRDLIVGTARRAGGMLTRTAAPKTTTEEFWALRNVDLDIQQGDVMGIVGRNGAGKSTLLKLLSRITEPTEGKFTFRGRVVSLLEVGTGFHPELSGRENIFLNGAILGMTKAEILRKFDEIVAFSEVEKFIDTPVKRYSSGMYVRLAFAVAAHLEPEILLVDEVLAVGDSAFQKKCIGKMKDVATKEGRTVLFVSHNMQATQALCTKAAQFENGTLVMQGEVGAVVSNYLTSLTSTESVRRWTPDEAPGDDDIRLTEVKAASCGVVSSSYSSSKDMEVEITFEAKRIPAGLCVGFDLVTPEAVTVLRTYQTDLAENQWPEARVGTNVFRCTLPAGLLNTGTYYISPRIGVHNVYWIVNLDAAIKFDLQLQHGISPYWNSLDASSRPGIFAPILRWEAQPTSTSVIQ